jgi:hypothetical protein
MRIDRIVSLAAVLALLATAPIWAAPGQAPGSVHGWWEGAGRLVPFHDPQKAPNTDVKEMLERITTETGDRWQVRWDKSTGYPRRLWGRSAQAYTGTPEEAAEQFIEKYRRIFIDVEDLDESSHIKFAPVGGARDSLTVSYKAFYQGIPMLSGGPVVRFDKDMHVISVSNDIAYPGDVELPTAQSPEAAVAPLLSALRPDSGQVVGDAQLVVYPSAPPRIAYQCTVNVWVRIGSRYQERPHGNEFIVDASTGEVLSVQNFVVSEFPLFPLSEDSTEYFGPFERMGRNTPLHEGKIPIIQMPPREADTLEGLPSPPPRDSAGIKRPEDSLINHFHPSEIKTQPRSGPAASGALSPQWFDIYDVWYYPQNDNDGDDFCSTVYLEWDADTDQPTATVRMVVYGRDSQNAVHLLLDDVWCIIHGDDYDSCGQQVTVPHKDSWDFRFVLMNNLGDSVATMEYGEDLDVVNVWMESRGEDANLSTQLLTTGYGPDMDYDGYPQHASTRPTTPST